MCHYNNYEILYEDHYTLITWGSPYVRGHMKIIIKKHYENLIDVSPEESHSLMDAWQKAGKALTKILNPDIINWQINCNWVRHIHGHIYPRWKEEPGWGEPIKLPSKKESVEKTYKHFNLTPDEKKKIVDLLNK